MDFNSIKLGKTNSQRLIEIEEITSKDVAIIGISCKFPTAKNFEKFWTNLRNGKDCITEFPESRKKDTDNFLKLIDHEQKDYLMGAFLDEIDKFDYSFFRLSPTEANLMSPNQRMFLEIAMEAMEDAGYGGSKLIGSRTGVYIGYEADAPYDYKRFIEGLDPLSIPLAVPGNLTPIIASRVSYLLDLRGPSMSIDTACSSSLVAIHTACKAIRNGECTMALAGSVKINILPIQSQLKLGIESSDGRTRTFDDNSDGTAGGEGVAAILLKPLDRAKRDGDHIYAVIKGSAANQDGRSIGITAPNVLAQEDVIVNAWKDANIDPETISYIEAHGTGTKLGDPIEIEGIKRAFERYTDKKRFCAIGSVKTNLGHLDNAAGIAGVIKAVMALKYGELPPSLHFNTPNRKINFIESPVYVNDRLRKWETDGFPRRCGVSSFGFSGTNCHLVLEEAPGIEKSPYTEIKQLHMLALSAKSENSLKLILEAYGRFIEKESNVVISDMCYTANTGRGHYGYRVAFAFENIEQLREKLNLVNLVGYKNVNENGIYYGCYKLIPDFKENKQPGEITDGEQRELSRQSRSEIESFLQSGKTSKIVLDRICSLYVRGSEIEFDRLYEDGRNKKVSLPVYPFERTRCWIKADTISKAERKSGNAIGTLVDQCILKSMDFTVYTKALDSKKDWILNEHKIMGKSVFVGTAYLELIQQVFSDCKIELREIMFLSPMIFESEEKRELQLIINKEGEGYSFSVVSKVIPEGIEVDENWSKHIQGKICNLSDVTEKKFDLTELRNHCNISTMIPNIAAYNEATIFNLGLHWDSIREICVGENEILTYIKIDTHFANEVKDFILHPALLDNALTTTPLLQKAFAAEGNHQEESVFLPFSYGTMKVYKALPASFYSYIQPVGNITENPQLVSFHIVLLDTSGEVLVEIENYTLKKVRNTKLLSDGQNQIKSIFFSTSWNQCEINNHDAERDLGNILVLSGTNQLAKGLTERLKEENATVIEAILGNGFERISRENYVISGSEEDYKKLFISIQNENITTIFHTLTLNDSSEVEDVNALDRSQLEGVRSLFYMLKAIRDAGMKDKVDMVLLSQYVNEVTAGEEMIKPENATLFGLAKVVAVEYPNIHCRCIDIDTRTGLDEIIMEVKGAVKPYTVAYREGKRYVEEFGSLDMEAIEERDIKINENGVYVITGGTGGIGLEIAKHMAAKNKVNLALVSRAEMPPKEEWDWIIAHGNDPKVKKKIKGIREIEKEGSAVTCYSADVSDWEQMKVIVNRLRQRYGRIHGVIHSAGEAGDGFLIKKEEKVFDRVLAPKVRGTWILDQLTAEDELDFFIMFSSATILKGVAGQGDYTSANLYQDSYEAYRKKKRKGTLTIHWAGWKETGMAFDHGVNFDGMFKVLSTKDAITAYSKVLDKNIGRVIIGEINYKNSLLYEGQALDISVSKEIAHELKKNKKELQQKPYQEQNEVILHGKANGEYTGTEKLLSKIYGGILGLSEINIYDDFYELGGDSLIGMKIINTINKEISTKVDISNLFANITIKEFAAYIDKLCLERDIRENAYESIQRAPELEYYPLSSTQKRLYILNRLEGDNTSYNMSFALSMEGKLNITRLEAAIKKLIERHESFRTSFETMDGEPVQRIHETIEFHVSRMEARADGIKSLVKGFIKPFELNIPPLFRVGIIKVNEDSHILLFDTHHIISDGASMGILVNDFIHIYNGSALPDLRIQYRDFAVWQNGMLANHAMKKQEAYWMDVFKGELPVLNMPADYHRPQLQSFEGERIQFDLGSDLTKELKSQVLNMDATLYMVLLAAYNVLLHKYTGQEDIIIGSPIAGRRHADIENIIGVFINTLAIRSFPHGEKTFSQFLLEIKNHLLRAYENQDYPFDELVEKLNIKRDLSRNPLFDTMFVLQNTDAPELKLDALNFGVYEIENNTVKFDITLDATVKENGIHFEIGYSTKLFKRETMERFALHFVNILREVLSNPEARLCDIQMLSEEEKHQILYGFNDTKAEYPKDKTIHQLFEEQVDRTPGNIAVVYEDQQLTYQELNEKSNQLARLLREKGVVPGSIVGILVERSPEMIIGIMGILKAGGAYLPISPDYPAERKRYMLEDSGTILLLAQGRFIESVDIEGEIINLENNEIYAGDLGNLETVNSPKDLAYVIYTSGSTGKPKGVMIEHYSLVNRLHWMQRKYAINNGDVILQKTPYTFDVSLWELFWWSFAGAKVCFLKPGGEKDPGEIVKAIGKNSVTTIHFVPSMLNVFLEYIEDKGDTRGLESLKQVFASGEAIGLQQVEKFNGLMKRNGAKLINLYGPTEATVDVSYFVCSAGEKLQSIPIGKPIDNIRLYIVDGNQNLQPVGVAGELCISGDGLARGYLNRPELTADRFVSNPYLPGQRMYRTGDLARWLPDGNIEFIGRMDHQVKIRGFRIELGEIEAQLLKHDTVKEAVVIAREYEDGGKYLCAYIVSTEELKVNTIREYLSKELPDYMIPSYLVRLDKLPLSASGKLDRKALPKPDGSIMPGTEYVAPTNDIEEKLAVVCQEVLGVEKVGINDNFFDIGGHSLKATILVSKIHKVIHVEMPLREVFASPTIRGMADYIKNAAGGIYSSIEPAPKKEYYPLSSAQKRLFILSKLENEGLAYNMPGTWIIEGELDKGRLEDTFRKLIRRHEILRTSFEVINGEPVQRVHEEVEFHIGYLEEKEEKAAEKIKQLIRPFDLGSAPLLRVTLIRIKEDRHIMLSDMHHIISDGTTMNVIRKEFAQIYQGKELPALEIQYKDYSAWQNKLIETGVIAKQKEYWDEMFKEEIPVLNLPIDYTRPSVQSFEGDNIRFELGEGIQHKINELARKTGTTVFMVLLAAYNTLLMKYTGQEDIVVGTPIAGRQHVDLENMVGVFINTLAMRNQPSGNKTFREFLSEIRRTALSAYENQDYQFEDLIEDLEIKRDTSRNPLFDVMLVLQNTDNEEVVLEGLKLKPYEIQNKISKLDLTLIAVERNNTIDFVMEYCTKLFKKETIERMAEHYQNILVEVLNHPDDRLSDIEMLSEKEKHQILYGFNETEAAYPKDKTIHQLFEEQVGRTPGSIAAVYKDQQLTFRELNKSSNQLARLLREKGVVPGSIVGIMAARSLVMIIGILGVLKAGGAYLPIDPEYPADRIKYMLEDSSAGIVLTQDGLKESMGIGLEIIDLEDKGIYTGEVENLEPVNSSKDLAYVIYTSGSTGKPKGVMLEHRAVNNFIKGMTEKIEFVEKKTILAITTISFDIFVLESILPLTRGMKIVIADEKEQIDPKAIGKLILENKIDMLQTTPSRMKMIIENGEGLAYLDQLKEIMVGGEAFPEPLLESLNKLNNTKIYNMYGPTETTVWSAIKDVTGCTGINLGTPIANTQIYIVDSKTKLQPIGVAGELCIGGDGLARGYLNQPDLTAEKFAVNPYNSGERMYRTGDLARWLPDGNIEFIGRKDHQVKIRGFRIELGEIENQLLKNVQIKEVAVIDREDTNGNKYLCAYIITDKELVISELREHLLKELPEYMVPAHFVKLERMPLTHNGKVDRKALPEPDGSINIGVAYAAPSNEIEEKLIKIFQEVLGIEKIGIDDNFFDLGGNSLNGMTLVSRIHKSMDVEIPFKELFSNSTVKRLGEYVEKAVVNTYALIAAVEEKEFYPISAAQKRMYITNMLTVGKPIYNMPVVMILEGYLDVQKLKRVLSYLIDRHDALRTSFDLHNDEVIQRIHKEVNFEMDYMDIEDKQTSHIEIGTDSSVEDIVEKFICPFDLSKAPLFRAKLIKLSEDMHLFMYDMHHIVTDGMSQNILTNEFISLYHGKALKPLRIQYKDFSEWQNARFNSSSFKKIESFWLDMFSGNIPVLRLPTDYPRPYIRSFEGDSISLTIGSGLTSKLNALVLQTRTTMFMVLLSAYNILLAKYTGQEDFVVGSSISGRPHPDLENIIGMFVNMLALRNMPEGNKSFLAFLEIVKENALKAFENQEYQFEMLVNKLGLQKDLSRNPLFDTVFNMQNIGMAKVGMESLKVMPYPKKYHCVSKFDLLMDAFEVDGCIELKLEYSKALFKESTIVRMGNSFIEILEQITQNPKVKIGDIIISNEGLAADSSIVLEIDDEFIF